MSTREQIEQRKQFDVIQRLEAKLQAVKTGEKTTPRIYIDELMKIQDELAVKKRTLADLEESEKGISFLKNFYMKGIDYTKTGKSFHDAAMKRAEEADEADKTITEQQDATAIARGSSIGTLVDTDKYDREDRADKVFAEMRAVSGQSTADLKELDKLKELSKSEGFFTKDSSLYTDDEAKSVDLLRAKDPTLFDSKEKKDYEAMLEETAEGLEDTEPVEDEVVRPDSEGFIGPTRPVRPRAGAGAVRHTQEAPKGFDVSEEDVKKIYADKGLEISEEKLKEFSETAKAPYWQERTKDEFIKQVDATVEKGVEEKTALAGETLRIGDTSTIKDVVKESVRTQVEPNLLAGTLLATRGKKKIGEGWSVSTRDEAGKMKPITADRFGVAEGIRYLGRGSGAYEHNLKAQKEGREDWKTAYKTDILDKQKKTKTSTSVALPVPGAISATEQAKREKRKKAAKARVKPATSLL